MHSVTELPVFDVKLLEPAPTPAQAPAPALERTVHAKWWVIAAVAVYLVQVGVVVGWVVSQ